MNELPFLPDTPALPPHNVDVEEAVLGGVLTDPNAIARVEGMLKPEDFFVRLNGRVYAAAIELSREGHPVDLIGMCDRLTSKGILAELGGRQRLADLAGRSLGAVNIDEYALLLVDKAKRRRLIESGSAIVRLGYATSEPIAHIFDEAEASVFGVTQYGNAGKAETAEEIIERVMAEVIQRATTGLAPGVLTAYYDYDELTQGGLHRGELTIVAGRPAMGKSAWATLAAKQVSEQGLPVIIFSLEMSKDQLITRLLASESRINSGRIRRGRVAEAEWPRLLEAQKRLAALPLIIDDQPGLTIAEIRSRSREIMATRGELGCIVIDYLQLMGGGDDHDRVKSLGAISRQLKQLARELNTPVIALSQLNRGVESRTNKRPTLSDLRDSGEIEENADVVAALYREEYYDPETADKGVAEVIILKHRSGATGTVKLLFEGDFTLFLNMAKPADRSFQPRTTMHRPKEETYA